MNLKVLFFTLGLLVPLATLAGPKPKEVIFVFSRPQSGEVLVVLEEKGSDKYEVQTAQKGKQLETTFLNECWGFALDGGSFAIKYLDPRNGGTRTVISVETPYKGGKSELRAQGQSEKLTLVYPSKPYLSEPAVGFDLDALVGRQEMIWKDAPIQTNPPAKNINGPSFCGEGLS